MNNSFFGVKNFILIGLGFAALVLGFYLLGQGPVDGPKSLTASPLILVITYVIIIPLGILLPSKKQKSVQGD